MSAGGLLPQLRASLHLFHCCLTYNQSRSRRRQTPVQLSPLEVQGCRVFDAISFRSCHTTFNFSLKSPYMGLSQQSGAHMRCQNAVNSIALLPRTSHRRTTMLAVSLTQPLLRLKDYVSAVLMQMNMYPSVIIGALCVQGCLNPLGNFGQYGPL